MPYFIGKILELPVTTTQDYSLFYILNQYSIHLWKSQIAEIMEKHGLASFIVHPDYIVESRTRDTYKSLLAYLAELRSEGKIWIALPREVNEWWRARSQMKLVRQGNNWVIEGPEKDKARIAYAVLDGDRLTYEPSLKYRERPRLREDSDLGYDIKALETHRPRSNPAQMRSAPQMIS